jgi:hypothetical protein
MSRRVPVNILVTDQFSLIQQVDDFSKVVSQTAANFTFAVWKNGVLVPTATVTLVETAVASGEYKITWTPDAVAYWVVEVVHGVQTRRYKFEYDVVTSAVIGSNRPPVAGT